MEEQKQAEQQWNKIRQERINILKEAPSEENLWQAVMAFQDYPFKTVTGLPFQYTLKTGKNGEWTNTVRKPTLYLTLQELIDQRIRQTL